MVGVVVVRMYHSVSGGWCCGGPYVPQCKWRFGLTCYQLQSPCPVWANNILTQCRQQENNSHLCFCCSIVENFSETLLKCLLHVPDCQTVALPSDSVPLPTCGQVCRRSKYRCTANARKHSKGKSPEAPSVTD